MLGNELPNYISIYLSSRFLLIYQIYFYIWSIKWDLDMLHIYGWLPVLGNEVPNYISPVSASQSTLPLWHIQIFPSSWISKYQNIYTEISHKKHINWKLTFYWDFQAMFLGQHPTLSSLFGGQCCHHPQLDHLKTVKILNL